MKPTLPSVAFPRRMIALVYDAIAVFTVTYFAGFIPVVAGGAPISAGNPLFTLYVLAIVFGYFGACWTRGRTLGMQVWKLEIVSVRAARPPTWPESLWRFGGALVSFLCFGLGYLAALWDPQGRTWHDRWSRTRIVRLAPLT